MARVLSRCFLLWPKPGWEQTLTPHRHVKGVAMCVCAAQACGFRINQLSEFSEYAVAPTRALQHTGSTSEMKMCLEKRVISFPDLFVRRRMM